MSQLVIVTSRFFAVTFREITLYAVNNDLIELQKNALFLIDSFELSRLLFKYVSNENGQYQLFNMLKFFQFCMLIIKFKIYIFFSIKSLALCTSLIMFALNQDKLIMEMEKETFNLLVSIINMNITLVNNGIELVKQDQETNDNEIYVKIYERCKDLCKKLIQTKSGETDEIFFANEFTSKKRSPNSKQQQNLEFNDFNPKLLAIECLLSMNLNKQNHNSIDLFKHELRDSGVLDKIIEIIKYTQTMIKQNKSHNNNNNNNNDELYYLFFIKKYNRYLNFLEILVQTVSSNTATSLTSNRIELDPPQNKKLKITSSNNNNNETTSCTVTNQNYILNYKNTFVNELIKESLTYFYDELLNLSQDLIENDKKIQLLLNSVKENFLLIINLTHNNGIQ